MKPQKDNHIEDQELQLQMGTLRQSLVPDNELIQQTQAKIRNTDTLYRNTFLMLFLPVAGIILLCLIYALCYARPLAHQLYQTVLTQLEDTSDAERDTSDTGDASDTEDADLIFLYHESGSQAGLSEQEVETLIQHGTTKTSRSLIHYRIGIHSAKIVISTQTVSTYKELSLSIYQDKTKYIFKRTKHGWKLVDSEIEEI
ncbi:MAG: hypothetical protein Q4D32_05020 [Eubacteriales bacterium]|nr:hypothetical protein [Eubacteriales bacterium]